MESCAHDSEMGFFPPSTCRVVSCVNASNAFKRDFFLCFMFDHKLFDNILKLLCARDLSIACLIDSFDFFDLLNEFR